MPCIDNPEARAQRSVAARARARARRIAAWLALCALAACNSPMPPDTSRHASSPAPAVVPKPAPPQAAYTRPAQTYDEYLKQIALRLVAVNPKITYMTPSPSPVPAILCLEIEVNADGSVRNIAVARKPAFDDMQDTIPIAIAAVRRAAPFGDATHLPRPWKLREYFLFDENRHFKPRELD